MNKTRLRTKFAQKDEVGNLFCYKCKDYKPVGQFDKASKESNWFRENRDRRCKICKSAQRKARLITNRDNGSLKRVLLERWQGVRDRSKKKGLLVEIDVDYLQKLWNSQKGLCAISGVPMTHIIYSGRVPTNVSVDRIDSTVGYTKGNVQLVCMAINQMKSDLTMEELLYFVSNIQNRVNVKNYVQTGLFLYSGISN